MAVAAACCDRFGLLEAVWTRDHKALEAIIKSHADVNAAQPDGATALAEQSSSTIARRPRNTGYQQKVSHQMSMETPLTRLRNRVCCARQN